MEERKIEFAYKVLKNEELSDLDDLLRRVVIQASGHAYAPYSKLNVGAAVMFSGGGHVKGCNQENAAYPSGLCAERVALFSARSTFPDTTIETLGIVALKDGNVQFSVSPCGACRQVLLETELRQEHDIRVVLFGRKEAIIVPSAKDLLPIYFWEANL